MKKSLVMVIFLGVLGMVGLANAGNYTTSLIFQTTDQSMWAPGDAFVLDYNKFLGAQWNTRDSVGEVVEGGIFGDYGAEIWGATSGKIGFDLDVHMDSGSVNVTYPVGITLSYPDKAKPGDTFTISSSYVVNSGASMTTNFPEANLSVDGVFALYAEAGYRVCVYDCLGDSKTFINENITYPILDIDTGDPVSFPIGVFGSVWAKIPDINTTATLGGKSLSSSGEDDFLNLTFDVDSAFTYSTGIPLNVEALGFTATLLNVDAGMALAATQEFVFIPNLMVGFKLENGYTASVRVGDSASFVFPEGFGDLDITPTFWLDNTFSNDTGMRIDPTFKVEALSLSGHGLNLGPLFSYDMRAEGPGFDIFSKDFQLQGFEQFTTASFSIEATPEPGTLVLLGIGLMSVGVLARKQRKSII